MPFVLSHEVVELQFRDPFRIARAEPDRVATSVIASLSHDGIDPAGASTALGEAFPVAYYGETPGTIAAVLPLLFEAVNALGDPPGEIHRARAWLESADAAMNHAIGRNGAAKCGLDIALHDWVAQRLGIALWQLLGTSPVIPPTDFSIGIDTPQAVAERASRAAHFPALKIKVGGPSDLATLEQVREVYTGPIRVDANTGWELEEGARLVPDLVRLGVELIEQPFPAHQHAQLRWLQEHSEIPIVVDESSVTIEDLENLVGVVAGVNVKLTKCGGVGPAKRMLERARELGFKRMLGCMEETSVGVAAGAAVASLADWIDLDGNLLLADEPFDGLQLGDDCRWQLGTTPGHGVRRRHRAEVAA